MKTRVTIYAENDRPVEKLGKFPEETVRLAWEAMLYLLCGESQEKFEVEKVEVWDD